MRRWAAGFVAASVVLSPEAANAFLVVGKTKTPPSDKAKVVALRDGRSTVLSIQLRVREKTGEIALLVPVPVAETTKTLAPRAFAPLGVVTAPRIVELWEADPCALHPMVTPPVGPSGSAPNAPPPAPTSPAKPKADGGPSDGATGYQVDVVNGKGAEIIAKLKSDGYDLPADSEPLLSQLLDGGMKLVVAKIDLAKLGGGDLPPLLVSYASDDLTFSTRLFASAGGRRDLELFVLSPGRRFESADQTNVAVPTNLDVTDAVLSKLPAFYSAVLDRTFEKAPQSLVTEYAWRASTCELCAAPLPAEALSVLGADLLSSARDGKQLEVVVDAEHVSSEPGGPEAMRAALGACYAKVLSEKPGAAGSLELDVVVDGGAVTSATPKNATGAAGQPERGEGTFSTCVTDAVKAAKLDKSGTMKVELVPLSRRYFNDLVLTKLHARYDSIPDKDLRLKMGRAIEGGREDGPDGKAEKKVAWAPGDNDLEPRYVVRHAFKGAVKCENPARGVWTTSDKKPKAPKASDDAVTAEALDKLVVGKMPELDAFTIAASEVTPAAAPSADPAPSATGAPAPSSSATSSSTGTVAPSSAPMPQPDAGCSCEVASDRREPSWPSLVGALFATVGIHRRKRSP